MTKREFLDRLERCLASLEDGERANMVEFYREQIEDRIDDGMAEGEAVASLEKPEDIAANILALRAESQAQSTASGVAGAEGAGEPSSAKPAHRHPVLRGIGIAILGFMAVVAAIVLIPVALGLAGAVVCAYLSLWVADVAVVLGALVCAAACVLVAITCFVAPVGSAAVMTATVALVVGLAALAVLLAIGSYFFGKLLVMLVVWPVRALQRRAARKREGTSGRVGASAAAAQPKRDYPSMPMPPMAGAGEQTARRRRSMPLWGMLAIGSAVLGLAALLCGFGVLAAVGGPERLLEEAGVSERVPLLDVDADEVDTIDLTVPAESLRYVGGVSVGVSPDDQIHVVGWSNDMTGTLYWGDVVGVQGSLSGSTVSLHPVEYRIWSIQNPFTSFNTAYRYGSGGQVVVLVPQDWQGDIVCDSEGDYLDVTIDHHIVRASAPAVYSSAGDPLRIAGDIDIAASGSATLDGVIADTVSVEAPHVGLYDVEADELDVNAQTGRGRAEVYRTEVEGTAELGGRQVIVDGLSAGNVETGETTQIVEEGPLEDATPADDGADSLDTGPARSADSQAAQAE